jgi:hypothetical protein
MNGLLDPETKLLIESTLPVKSVCIYVDEGIEDVIFTLNITDQYWYNLQDCNHYEKSNKKVLVLHKLEDPSTSARVIDLMCID